LNGDFSLLTKMLSLLLMLVSFDRFSNLNELVNVMFPGINLDKPKSVDEEWNSWNYWKIPTQPTPPAPAIFLDDQQNPPKKDNM
jgi:hypothetical protein